MKKLITPLALLGLLYVGTAEAEDIAFTKVDDGRPQLIDQFKKFDNSYLDIDTSLHITDYQMINHGLEYTDFVDKIDVPPMDFSKENMDKLYELIVGINGFTGLNIRSTSSGEVKMKYGTKFKEGTELHLEGGFEGKMDYKLNGIEEIKWGMLGMGPRGYAAHFSGDQEIIKGVLYYDTFIKSTVTKPFEMLGMITLQPFIGAGYKRRFLKYDKVSLDEYVGANEDVYKERYEGWGNGIFFDVGIIIDASKISEAVRPKIAVSMEDLGIISYDWGGTEISQDPVTFNIALKLTPKDLFDISAELKIVGLNPELRIEIAKQMKHFEVALYGRINELTLAGFKRHSGNAFFGYTGKFLDIGAYLGYDSNSKVSFGTAISFHLED
ncbi:MAG: hypothetical protein ABIB71_03545 [Candidatus Woesearchaeota archaeon]